MKRREFLRNAAIVAATSGLATEVKAAEGIFPAEEEVKAQSANKTGGSLIDSEPVLQNYAATSMGIAFSVTDWANGYVIYGEKPDLSDGKKVWCGGYRVSGMDNEVIQIRLVGLKPSTLYYYKIGADRIEYKDGYHIRIIGNEEKPQTYSFRTAGERAKSHFCVINDTHASWKAINPTINKIMELQPSCVIWNGDACNTEETVEAQERKPRDWDLGRNFAVRMGDIALIGLDTGEDKLDTNPKFCNLFVSEPYRVAQQTWLRDALKQPEIASAPYLVAFCHIPLYDPNPKANPGDVYPDDKDEKYQTNFAMWQRTCAKLWGPLLEEAGCQLLITAHQHCVRFDKPNEVHKWFQIVGGGPNMTGKSQGHFPTVIEGEIRDGKLVVTVHNIYTGNVCGTVTFGNPR